MNFVKKEWIGSWENFENYIDSDEPAMRQAWERAEDACRQMPEMAAMISSGARSFWKAACSTVTDGNPIRLGGWNIEEAEDGLRIDWLSEEGASLGRERYRLERMVERGLEGKKNYLFFAPEAADKLYISQPSLTGTAETEASLRNLVEAARLVRTSLTGQERIIKK